MAGGTWLCSVVALSLLLLCDGQSWGTNPGYSGSQYGGSQSQYGQSTDRYNTDRYNNPNSASSFGGGNSLSPFQVVYEWFKLDYNWLDEMTKGQALSNRRFIPENNALAGIKVWRDRIFVTIPRWKEGVPVTIASIPSFGSQPNASPRLDPFPNWQMQEIGNCSAFQFVQSMEIDTEGRIWVLDIGRTNTLEGGGAPSRCPPKLVIIDLNSVQFTQGGQYGSGQQGFPGSNYPNQGFQNTPGQPGYNPNLNQQYPNTQYPNNQQYNPNNPNQQYPNQQYPNNQYNNPSNQYNPNSPNSQFNTPGQYNTNQYNNPSNQYNNPNSQYSNQNNQYGRSNQFGSSQYPNQYGSNQYPNQYGQYNNTPQYDQFGNPIGGRSPYQSGPGGYNQGGFNQGGFGGFNQFGSNFRIIKSYNFPSNVATQFGNYMNDIVLDNSNGWYAYITDHGDDPGIIVYNFREDRSWKVKDARSMRSDPDISFLSVNNIDVELRGKNIDGLALSPQAGYERTLYFSPLGSYNLYSLPTSVLKRDNTPSDVSSSVTDLGRKQSVSDGMIMDNRGNLYFGLLGLNAVGVWNSKRGRFTDSQRILARDNRALQWPDTFAIDDQGNLYVVTNRLQNYLTGRVNMDEPNYRILKAPIGGRSYLYPEDLSQGGGRYGSGTDNYGRTSGGYGGYGSSNSYDSNYYYWNSATISTAATTVVLVSFLFTFFLAR